MSAVEQAGQTSAPLGTGAVSIVAGKLLTVSVVIQNKVNGHSHVPEQRDMYESWVRFTVTRVDGKVLYESGDVTGGGNLDPEVHSFTNRLINVKGTLNERHEVRTNRVVAYDNTIQSGRSQVIRYAFVPPAEGTFPVTVSVQYRRFNRTFLDLSTNQRHYAQPVVEMVSAARVLTVGTATPAADAANNPLWMRWNKDGIALLDAQQYAASSVPLSRCASCDRPTETRSRTRRLQRLRGSVKRMPELM